MRFRLLYVLDNYWPHIGGSERAFKVLCESMAALGHEVTVMTLRQENQPAEAVVEGVKIIRVSAGRSRYLFSCLGILRCLRLARHADIIHAVTFNAAPIAAMAGIILKKPTILTVLETWIGRWRDYSEFSPLKAALHDLAERLIFSFPFDAYVGISRYTSDRVRAVVRRAKDRVSTIYFGFDAGPWAEHPTEGLTPEKLTTTESPFLIVAYGRPGTSKGFVHLIDAFAEIQLSLPNASLVLVLSSSSQYSRELIKLKLRAGRGISFMPTLPSGDLIRLVQSANCVVVPSLTEGFGYTTLEAAASGVPIVASNTASIPEVIGGRYILVAPRDSAAIARAVIKIANGEVQRKACRTFSWSDTVSQYELIYGRLVHKGLKHQYLGVNAHADSDDVKSHLAKATKAAAMSCDYLGTGINAG